MSTEEKQPANIDEALRGRAREFEDLIRAALVAAVRLALIRRNIELEPDTATEEEIAADAAGACFGEETCSDKPIQEIAKLRAFATALLVSSRPTDPNPGQVETLLEHYGWTERFGKWGCDTVEQICEALQEAEQQLAEVRAQVEAYKQADQMNREETSNWMKR